MKHLKHFFLETSLVLLKQTRYKMQKVMLNKQVQGKVEELFNEFK